MKVVVIFAILLLAGCADRPPPITGPSYQMSHGDLTPTRMVWPRQPASCLSFDKDAPVEVSFIVEPDGSVSDIKVLTPKSGVCDFASEVVFSFHQWKFKPYLENGVPVRHVSYYKMVFKPVN